VTTASCVCRPDGSLTNKTPSSADQG
jgi:hypothetical protein